MLKDMSRTLIDSLMMGSNSLAMNHGAKNLNGMIRTTQ